MNFTLKTKMANEKSGTVILLGSGESKKSAKRCYLSFGTYAKLSIHCRERAEVGMLLGIIKVAITLVELASKQILL